MNDLHADPHDFRVRSKKTVNNVAAQAQQHTDQDGRGKAHEKTAPDPFPNPVALTGPVVLACKCGDGDTEGTNGHPEEGVYLAIDSPGSNGVGSKSVDGGLDDDIGKTVHNGLQPGRKTNADDPMQHLAVGADSVQIQSVHVLDPDQHEDHQGGAQSLGTDGGDSRACHTQIETHDQKKIQQDIGETACNQEIERASGVAHCPQDAGTYIIDQIADSSYIINADVENGRIQHIGRGVHGSQDGRSGHDAAHHQKQSADDTESHGGVYGVVYQFRFLCAVVLGDDHRCAAGQAYEETD